MRVDQDRTARMSRLHTPHPTSSSLERLAGASPTPPAPCGPFLFGGQPHVCSHFQPRETTGLWVAHRQHVCHHSARARPDAARAGAARAHHRGRSSGGSEVGPRDFHLSRARYIRCAASAARQGDCRRAAAAHQSAGKAALVGSRARGFQGPRATGENGSQKQGEMGARWSSSGQGQCVVFTDAKSQALTSRGPFTRRRRARGPARLYAPPPAARDTPPPRQPSARATRSQLPGRPPVRAFRGGFGLAAQPAPLGISPEDVHPCRVKSRAMTWQQAKKAALARAAAEYFPALLLLHGSVRKAAAVAGVSRNRFRQLLRAAGGKA